MQEKRASYRIVLRAQPESVTFRYAKKQFAAKLLDHSATGFRISVDDASSIPLDAEGQLADEMGRFVVRVVRKASGPTGDELGLERLGDLAAPSTTEEIRLGGATVRLSRPSTPLRSMAPVGILFVLAVLAVAIYGTSSARTLRFSQSSADGLSSWQKALAGPLALLGLGADDQDEPAKAALRLTEESEKMVVGAIARISSSTNLKNSKSLQLTLRQQIEIRRVIDQAATALAELQEDRQRSSLERKIEASRLLALCEQSLDELLSDSQRQIWRAIQREEAGKL